MSDRRKQAEGVVARMRKLGDDAHSIANDLEAILNDSDTTGQQVNRLFARWGFHWKARHKRDYQFTSRAKVGAAFKKLLATMTAEDIDARMQQYVASSDPFYANASHPVELFLKAINKFPGTGHAGDELALTAPVSDCQHKPRCKSDQEHTRRRTAEMRQ